MMVRPGFVPLLPFFSLWAPSGELLRATVALKSVDQLFEFCNDPATARAVAAGSAAAAATTITATPPPPPSDARSAAAAGGQGASGGQGEGVGGAPGSSGSPGGGGEVGGLERKRREFCFLLFFLLVFLYLVAE